MPTKRNIFKINPVIVYLDDIHCMFFPSLSLMFFKVVFQKAVLEEVLGK